MISVDEALKIILHNIEVLGLERVDILNSLGRVLGEDVHAPYHIPPWDNSAMDGYAVIHEAVAHPLLGDGEVLRGAIRSSDDPHAFGPDQAARHQPTTKGVEMGMKDLRDKHPGIAKKIAPTKVEKAA